MVMKKFMAVLGVLLGILASYPQALTLQEAVAWSLSNHPALKSVFQDYELTDAQIQRESGLPNPIASGAFLSGAESKKEWGVEQDISKWFFAFLKGKHFDAQRAQTKAAIAKAVIEQRFQTKLAYVTFQSDLDIHELNQQVLESEKAALDLAQKQFDAGNTSALDLAIQKSVYTDRQIDFEKSLVQLDQDHLLLQQELGVTTSNWAITEKMPNLPITDPTLAVLESSVSKNIEMVLLEVQLTQIKESQFSNQLADAVQSISVGIKQESEGVTKTGPSFQVSVPLWNQGQNSVRKDEAEIKKLMFLMQTKKQALLTEIRMTYAQLLSLKKQAVLVQASLIPARTEALDQTLKHYNYMLKGVYALLQAKQEELTAKKAYLILVRDYWVTRWKLEQLTGLDFSKESRHD